MANSQNPVNWFEIPVANLKRARTFYEKILGVELRPQDLDPERRAMFPMEESGSGSAGSLVKAWSYEPSHAGTMVYFRIADIDACLGRVVAEGGKVLTPKTSIGEYGFIAHIEDSEGNRVALHSER